MNVVWESRGQRQSALREFSTAVQRARDLDDPVLLIGFLNDLGLVQRENQEFDSGFDALREAFQIAESIDDPFHILLTKSNMVSALLLQHDYATAAVYCRDCRDLLIRYPEFRGFERLIDFNEARCAFEFRDYPVAISLFAAAHAGSVTESDLYFSALSSFEEGRAQFLANDLQGATTAFSRSLEEWNQISTSHRSAPSVMSQWWIESLTKAWTWRTVADLRQILERPDSESQEMCIRIFDALAESLEKLGDLKASIGYLREVAQMKESFWKGVAIGRSHQAARAHQTAEAQRIANSEREQRQEIDLAMQRVVRLNNVNEQLVAELQAQSLVLEQLAGEDPLTALSNRRHFDEHLTRELERERRSDHPFAVALIDVDNLKAINDRFSHATGDEILRAVGQIIRNGCRESDVVARYGGNEFALLLPELDRSMAEEMANRLQRDLETRQWPELGSDVVVSASFGLVIVESQASHAAILVAADRQLYGAKRLGKNRVVAEVFGSTVDQGDGSVAASQRPRTATGRGA